ncbi:unnamed protein product [Rotaria socialis]|uniref:Uncharacterized protein n=1 Tax=Rotaria socialis TaxID=392032 RepID=A0A819YQG8_9BILA|nr:unnamed protein product [Rotaria socialis]CAF3377603.1 unnamed protein product [Rotaria socialis]CAF3624918.1 unnamed protein product [Rotaria socialis]CAF4161254.1 unnamed protein product [Rotaria socialis]CAF4163693.1 unnamed protein product [Rotaria socialis]
MILNINDTSNDNDLINRAICGGFHDATIPALEIQIRELRVALADEIKLRTTERAALDDERTANEKDNRFLK